MTLSLFAPRQQSVSRSRWYQDEASDAIDGDLLEYRSTLVVLPTGMGKTYLFTMKVKQWANEGRVLVLVHRDELVQQAKAELERGTGWEVYIEQASLRAPFHARVVVASVDTIKNQKRLDRFGPDFFTHIVIDEAHHYVAKTYRRPLDYFKHAKLLGVTATPDRLDGKALGRIFESRAYVMQIWDGIQHGYLVPIDGRYVQIQTIELDKVRVVAGDLQQSQLDLIMLKSVEGIIKETIRLAPDRQTIGFWPGVPSALAAAERMNYLRPGSACVVHAGTPWDERRQLVRKFKSYAIQYLFNVDVATEGFDAPCCSCILQARPTMSRGKVTQMVGRGTRPLTGVIDPYRGRDDAMARRSAIACSDKPNLLVLDFVGNSTKHDLQLASLEDILGGSYEDKEVQLAKKLRKEAEKQGGEMSPLDALQQARERFRKSFAKVESTVTARVVSFDPFERLKVKHDKRYEQRYGWSPATPKQVSALKRFGVEKESLKGLSKRDASRLLDAMRSRVSKKLCSFKQLKALGRYGVTDQTYSFEAASRALDYTRGRHPRLVDKERLMQILKGDP